MGLAETQGRATNKKAMASKRRNERQAGGGKTTGEQTSGSQEKSLQATTHASSATDGYMDHDNDVLGSHDGNVDGGDTRARRRSHVRTATSSGISSSVDVDIKC